MYSGDEGFDASVSGRKKRSNRGSAAAPLPPVIGIEFTKLLEMCVDKLLVGSDSALRTHLVELKVGMSGRRSRFWRF
jgi:hypothetical protein